MVALIAKKREIGWEFVVFASVVVGVVVLYSLCGQIKHANHVLYRYILSTPQV